MCFFHDSWGNNRNEHLTKELDVLLPRNQWGIGHRELLRKETKYFTTSRSEQACWVEDSGPEDKFHQFPCTLVLRPIKNTGNQAQRNYQVNRETFTSLASLSLRKIFPWTKNLYYEVMLSKCHHGQGEEYSKAWSNWLWGNKNCTSSSAACGICKGETAESKRAPEML